MPDSRAEAPAQNRRTWLVRLGYAAFGIVLFAAFVIATFPYSATLSKVLAPMGLQVASANQRMDFPFGAQLTDFRVTSNASSTGAPVFESPDVSVAPSIVSLLLFHPGVRVKASLYGGVGRMIARPSGDGTAVSFALSAVDISQQHIYEFPGITALGILSGTGDFRISRDDFEKNTGHGELSASGLTINSPLAPVRLGDAAGTFKLDRGTLTIENLKTTGGDVILNASGTVQLGPDPDTTILAIQFTLTPTPDAARRLGFLFAALPHPPGVQPYQISGTLSAPRLS
jgi:type II secretion system protein N